MTDLPEPLPAPGLQGDYRDSCIVCLRGTDTALALRGEAEWIIAALVRLGVPSAQALVALTEITGCDPGKVPNGAVTVPVRVCTACAAAGGTGMTVALVDGRVPVYGQA